MSTPQELGFILEQLIHNTLSVVPDLTCYRECDISRLYGDHIKGIDHMILTNTKCVMIQDKWEECKPDIRDIGHFKSQSDLIKLPDDIEKFNIFVSKQKPSTRGGAILKEHEIVHVSDINMSGLVYKTVIETLKLLEIDYTKYMGTLRHWIALYADYNDICKDELEHVGKKIFSELSTGIKIHQGDQLVVNALTTFQSELDDLFMKMVEHLKSIYTRCRSTSELNILLTTCQNVKVDLRQLDIKGIWDAMHGVIGTYSEHYDPQYHSIMNNLKSTITNMISKSEQINVETKKKYKWKHSHNRGIKIDAFVLLEKFSHSARYCAYGKIWWKELKSLTMGDLNKIGTHFDQFGIKLAFPDQIPDLDKSPRRLLNFVKK